MAFEKNIFPAIPLHRQLADMLRPGRRGWAAIGLALDSAKEHALRVVMYGLEALGHRKVVGVIRTSLNHGNERTRANAIESLASLPQRRFAAPLTPLLEGWREAVADDAFDAVEAMRLLRLAASSPDQGLRAAAVVASHAETGEIAEAALDDPSPFVAETARRLREGIAADSPYQQEAPMNRLTFLHSVPLFAKASLDDLIVIDRTISCETYVRGEEIVTEGDPGDRLCIVYRGEVAVRRKMPDGERELARLGTGDFFGEMSLFDDEPRSASVAAVDEVEVLVLSRGRFHSLVQQRPAILMRCARPSSSVFARRQLTPRPRSCDANTARRHDHSGAAGPACASRRAERRHGTAYGHTGRRIRNECWRRSSHSRNKSPHRAVSFSTPPG